MTERYDLPNVKFTKMLSFFSVVEGYSLIYPRPLGKNSGFASLERDLCNKSHHLKAG